MTFTLLGPLFFTIGVGSLCVPIMSARKKAWLQVNGQPITTELQRVGTDRSLKVNGRSPYRIYSQWKNPGTGQVHVFKSEAIWFDPAPFTTQKSIRVLIARDNPKKYWMDVSFLPKDSSGRG